MTPKMWRPRFPRIADRRICSVLLMGAALFAVAMAPADPPTLAAAHRLFVLENYEEALKVYRQVIDSTDNPPTRAEALYLVGRCHQRLEAWDKAIDAYEQVEVQFPGTRWQSLALLKKGDCLSQLGSWDKAVRAYNDTLESNEEPQVESQARLNRATILANGEYTGNDLEQAEEDFHYVASNTRDRQSLTLANFGLAEVRRRQGDLNGANYYYNQVTNLDSSNVLANSARSLQAEIYDMLGQPQVALEQYQRVAEDRNSPQYLKKIAQENSRTIQQQAESPMVRIKADRIHVRPSRQIFYRGNVEIDLPEGALTCDEAVYDKESRRLTCTGNVLYRSQPTWSLQTERLELDMTGLILQTGDSQVSE